MNDMIMTILLAIVAAVAGGFLYTIVGIIPGTDETATMVPTTIILVLAGAPAGVLFAWEVGIIVAMQCSHTIPTAMTGLPGSTMAVPLVQGCTLAKRLGVPHMAMRKMAADIIGEKDFMEIYLSTPLEECEKRDVKGLYAKARRGEIQNFTGITAPFEAPLRPALTLDTSVLSLEESMEKLLTVVYARVFRKPMQL